MSLADIDTIIVVMMENRSFDHMLGYLSLPGPDPMAVDGLHADEAWRDRYANVWKGQHYKPSRLDPAIQAIDDPPHDYRTIARQIDTLTLGGQKMGGFVEQYGSGQPPPTTLPERAMGYYDAAAVRVYDFFARNFVVCDRWFSALPAGTQPNRLMAMAGESKIADNSGLFLPDQTLVYDWLDRNKVNWCSYLWGGYLPFFALSRRLLPKIVTSLTLHPASGPFRRYSNFAKTWASAKPMPKVMFIEPEYGDGPHSDPNDDHPPTGVAKGQAFLADIYTTLVSNPRRWARTMMVVTYDEHGGFFDHVPPIGIPTTIGQTTFPTTGVRVPAFVISPQVEAGAVFHRNLDHTSVLELLAEKFTPGHGYSEAVNARHVQLDRLSATLTAARAAAPRRPALPHELRSEMRAFAAVAPLAPPRGASPKDPPNAKALRKAALQAIKDHPDLMSRPEWDALRRQVLPGKR